MSNDTTINPTYNAVRRQLRDIQQTAAGFDGDITRMLARDEDPLSALDAARMLVTLDGLRDRIEQERDRLTEAAGDLDVIDLHQHDGAARAE